MYKYLLAGILFLAVSNVPFQAQAGGGPVEFSVEPNQALIPGEQYVVHARVYADGPYPTYCKNCYIKLGLQNPQDSDYIAQDSERTNDEGRIYAKVISKVPGKRTVYVSELRTSEGTYMTANSTVVLSYKGDPSEITIPQQPYLTAENFPKVKVVSERYIEGPKREVNLAWNAIPGAISYNVYLFDENDNSFGGPTITTTSTSATITINAFINYYVGVDACFPTFCIGNHENLWKVYVQKMRQPAVSTQKPPTSGKLINWTTNDVSLKTDGFAITIDGKRYRALDPKIEIRSDPADPPSYEYTTLEAKWFENGVEMRMNLYFSYKPGQFWKLYEVRTYNGQKQGDWIYYTPTDTNGNAIQHSLGETYQKAGALTLKSSQGSTITFENIKLKAFTNNPFPDSGETTGISNPKSGTPSADQSVDTLQQKVSDLEEKLQKSEAKQSMLEQRIADLVKFLKRLFPFLK